MSPPLHVHVPTFQVQGQGHFWRVLDFGLSLRLMFGFHSNLHYYFNDLFQMWLISLVSMAHPSTHLLTPLLTLEQGQCHLRRVLDLGLSLRLTFGFHS
jgi:hypothetical protein